MHRRAMHNSCIIIIVVIAKIAFLSRLYEYVYIYIYTYTYNLLRNAILAITYTYNFLRNAILAITTIIIIINIYTVYIYIHI
jgi:hypothetical protein